MQCQTEQHANIESCLKRSVVVLPAVSHEDLGIACVAVFQDWDFKIQRATPALVSDIYSFVWSCVCVVALFV